MSILQVDCILQPASMSTCCYWDSLHRFRHITLWLGKSLMDEKMTQTMILIMLYDCAHLCGELFFHSNYLTIDAVYMDVVESWIRLWRCSIQLAARVYLWMKRHAWIWLTIMARLVIITYIILFSVHALKQKLIDIKSVKFLK